MRHALLLAGLLILSASAQAQKNLPPPSGNFRATPGMSNRVANVTDDRRICLVEKSTGREICKTYAAWRERARQIEARRQGTGSESNP
jgi:hypothetical protein